MSKAVLVIDMPENGCMDCDICREFLLKTICGITGNGVAGNRERGGFPDWCPLVPVPEKITEPIDTDDVGKDYSQGTMDGWNACIDAITGE